MFNVAYKFVGKHDEAEDLTQDIFLKLFRSLDTFDRRANFQTWLISVSRNLCIDHYRRVRKERETIDRDVDPGDLRPRRATQARMRRSSSSDRVVLLRAACEDCPKTLRSAVMLRDIHELSYQEIADRLACRKAPSSRASTGAASSWRGRSSCCASSSSAERPRAGRQGGGGGRAE